jgi:hypothetical protein
MMLAKLYHRPLIGIARYGGKFVRPEKNMPGRRIVSYINPFVAATCDWLIYAPSQLPEVADKLFTAPVKTNQIVIGAAYWYAQSLLREDKTAQTVFATA